MGRPGARTGLEAEVALDVHEDPRRLAAGVHPDARDVLGHQVELAGGICGARAVKNGARLESGRARAPLHAVRMSTPTTCPGARKDVLFHVLYGGSREYVSRLIERSVLHVADEHPTDGVRSALQDMRPAPDDSLHALQIKFFALLNEDERMRQEIASVQGRDVCGLCPHKAERLYDALSDELMPAWIKDERIRHDEFVDRLRSAYLCS